MVRFSPKQFLKELKDIKEADTFEQLREAERKVDETLKKLELKIKRMKDQTKDKHPPSSPSHV